MIHIRIQRKGNLPPAFSSASSSRKPGMSAPTVAVTDVQIATLEKSLLCSFASLLVKDEQVC